MTTKLPIFSVITFLIFLLSAAKTTQAQIEIGQNKTVLFAGGTNMVRMQRAGFLETLLTQHFAENNIKVRDFSWEADTVYRQGSVIERWRNDGFGNREQQIKRLDPDVVICQFGKLESLQGKDAIEEFKQAYTSLINDFKRASTTIVLVSPIPFEPPQSRHVPDLTSKNKTLSLYVSATKKLATELDCLFVDLSQLDLKLTDNGLHVTAQNQKTLAQALGRKLGIASAWTERHDRTLVPVKEKHRLWYDYWRPANWKLLYGDDSRREFTKASEGFVPFREEWKRLVDMIAKEEARIWKVAQGGEDPGNNRPEPEKLHGDANANVAEELKAFKVAKGLQVNLFASDKEGLTSPLAIRWDTSGKAYVTVTTTYPHVFPGDIPNDKIYVLEDFDKDGVVDQSTLFADGLNIPTGLELGDGGVYVGQNTEILFLKDTDGDNKADVRKVILGGFGNGDSHQTINSFVWSPGGELYMGQGDGCESRVETPWGASELYQAGFYRLRPKRMKMDPLLDDFMGPGNPWGVQFDDWGQIFCIDGAGGVSHLSLGQIPAKRRLRLDRIGNPGGYCGIAHLDGGHLPKEFHGQFAIGDFKANRVKCFSVTPNGASFKLKWEEHLLQSSHRNFRPVDVRMGPDGAIYVVDWYNPITCHQDDRYRDPKRDKTHGRIWRISSTKPSIQFKDLKKVSTADVVQALAAPERFTRYQAKRELTNRDEVEVAKALEQFIYQLDPTSERYEFCLYEALGAYATIEIPNRKLLTRLLNAKDSRARAFASRIAGRWHDRIDDALELLAQRTIDSDRQVRMEAVAAAAQIPKADSIKVVAKAFQHRSDQSMNYVLQQAVHHLKKYWEPALMRGEIEFDDSAQVISVLTVAGGGPILNKLRKMAASEKVPLADRLGAITVLVSAETADDINQFGLNKKLFVENAKYDEAAHAQILAHVYLSVAERMVLPNDQTPELLKELLDTQSKLTRRHVIRLIGHWRMKNQLEQIRELAGDKALGFESRRAALWAIGRMDSDVKYLLQFVTSKNAKEVQVAAVEALAEADLDWACKAAPLVIENDKRRKRLSQKQMSQLLGSLLSKNTGASKLATALSESKMEAESAREILKILYSLGRTDPVLVEVLNARIGIKTKPREFNVELVRDLAKQARKTGDAARGAKFFKSLACNSCHQVSGTGGDVGPELTSIGTTLAPERIIEEVLWPNRQIKEGYSLLQVATVDGLTHQGYLRRSRDSDKNGDVILMEPHSKRLITIKKEDVEAQKAGKSMMPTGMTNLLTNDQLIDLIAYLSDLGKLK